MAIVAEYKIGNCKVYIDDSCMVKTKEEVDKILRDIGEFYADCIRNGTIDVEKFIESE